MHSADTPQSEEFTSGNHTRKPLFETVSETGDVFMWRRVSQNTRLQKDEPDSDAR